jgi:uncharacterized protein (TIGR02246 family)
MLPRLSLAGPLGAFFLAGCAQAPAPAPLDTSADVAAIKALSDREMAAFAEGSTPELEAVFTADAVLLPPSEPALQGLPAAVAWSEALHEAFTVEGSYTSSDVTVSGDLAVQRFEGRLTMTPKAGGEPTSETVRGIHVLQRQADGSWKITQDVWNTVAAAPETSED